MAKKSKPIEPIDPFELFIPEMELAKSSPRFQIIVTNGILELLIDALVQSKCKNATFIYDLDYYVRVTILHEMGIIKESEFKTLKAFNKLRNKAAHASFTLTIEMLIPFKETLEIHCYQRYYNLEGFYHICLSIVVILWNANLDVLRPIFFPELDAELKKDILISNSLK